MLGARRDLLELPRVPLRRAARVPQRPRRGGAAPRDVSQARQPGAGGAPGRASEHAGDPGDAGAERLRARADQLGRCRPGSDAAHGEDADPERDPPRAGSSFPLWTEARLLRRGPRAPAAVLDRAVRLRRDAPPAEGRRDPPRGLQAPSFQLRRDPSDRRGHERLSPLRPVAVRGRPGGPSDQLHGRRPQRTNAGAVGRDRCPRRPVNLVRELADDHPLGLRRGRSGDRLRRSRSHRDCPARGQRASVQDGGCRPARGLHAVGRRRRAAAVEAARQRGGPPDC